MKKTTEVTDKRTTLNEISLFVFEQLHRSFIATLPDADRETHIKLWIADLSAYLDYDDPEASDLGEPLAKALNLTWDRGSYLSCIDNYESEEFTDLMDDPEVSIEMMGLVEGFHLTLKNLMELQVLMNKGQDVLSQYLSGEETRMFWEMNQEDLNYKIVAVFNDLVTSYLETSTLPTTDYQLYAESELTEFNRLFKSGEEGKDWSYVADRLVMSQDEIREVYADKNAVMNGKYYATVFSFNSDQRLNYAILLAVQKYMSFIRDIINTPRLYEEYKKGKPVVDDRIQLSGAARHYLQDCLMEMTLDINGHEGGKPIMSKEDINYLLVSNFKDFSDEPPMPTHLFTAGFTSKTHLSHFIYKVLEPLMSQDGCYLTYGRICRLIQENFEDFQDQSLDSVQRAMTRESKVPVHLMEAIARNKKMLKEQPKVSE